MQHVFGSHTLGEGGMDMAVRRAHAAGFDAVQIFTAIPKFYGDKSGIRPDRIERFRRALDDSGIAPGNVLVHAAYVLNLATTDEAKWLRAAGGLKQELVRSSSLGVDAVCFHPGSATDGDLSAGIARIACAMTEALRATDGAVRLLVENTAGAGRTIGRTPEEVGAILARIPGELRSRAGYGLDTCHLYASGYDIAADASALASVLDAFERAAGEPPSFFHLNDSAGELGSNRDRHVLLGEGHIGEEPFRRLLGDRRSRGVPLILETPQRNADVARDDAGADPYDVRMLALLRKLAA